MSYNIAIDGPAGAGKSSVARELASRLSFIYVDTGAMYRAMALYFLREGITPSDQSGVEAACDQIHITIVYQDGVQQVYLNRENVTHLIRTEQVGNMASAISVFPPVREKLLDLQRQLARESDVVMDGRDIGTCVLPHADVKVYLTASSKVRALRRYKELKEKGISSNLEEIEQDIIERDHRDMNRSQAPLKQADDAVYLDSSSMTLEEVITTITNLIGKVG